jgi:phosphatidylinositol alpha-1,6-mannosyltransferase
VALLADPELRARAAAAGPGWVRDSWTWDQRFATLHRLLVG